MEPKYCTECSKELKWIPPGISKASGKSYNGFWACPDKHRQNQATAAPQPSAPQRIKTESEVDWDAKDRQSMAQTAMKSASEIVAALISVDPNGAPFKGVPVETVVKDMANNFFKEIRKMKTMVNIPEDLDNWPNGQ